MAGYNYQMNGSWVIGLQGEFGLSDISSDLNLGIVTSEAGPTYTVSVSGRLGWLSSPDTMLYMLAGYTHARYTKLSAHLSARVEYRFTQYGKEDWDTGGIINIEPSSHKGMILNKRDWLPCAETVPLPCFGNESMAGKDDLDPESDQSTVSGRYSARARLENRVRLPLNCTSTVPVGPWRCLAMMISAVP